MAKIEWEKDTKKRRAAKGGTEKVYMLDLPPSHAEIARAAVPEKLRGNLRKFLRKVVISELDGEKLPRVSDSLKAHLQKHINREGGVLECARWFPEYNVIYTQEKNRRERPKDAIRKRFQHRVAKAQARGTLLADLQIPSEIEDEVKKHKSLVAWAKSRPGYAEILKSAEKFERGRQKRKDAGKADRRSSKQKRIGS